MSWQWHEQTTIYEINKSISSVKKIQPGAVWGVNTPPPFYWEKFFNLLRVFKKKIPNQPPSPLKEFLDTTLNPTIRVFV